MTLDDELLVAVDKAVKRLHTTRSAFARQAFQDALKRLEIIDLEERHRQGYERHPVKSGEFDDWVAEQNWGEE
jgi:metal-responsive CopG/Arc/MetJ family transcriptional regulator